MKSRSIKINAKKKPNRKTIHCNVTAVPAANDERGVRERNVHVTAAALVESRTDSFIGSDGHVDVAERHVHGRWQWLGQRLAHRTRWRPPRQGHPVLGGGSVLHPTGIAQRDARGRHVGWQNGHAYTRDEARELGVTQ